MLGLILPIIIMAAVFAATLGISYVCLEILMKIMARSLTMAAQQSPTVRRPINPRNAHGKSQVAEPIKTRLQALASQ